MSERKIQTGDLLLFRPTGVVGRLICKITRSQYCHVGIAFVESDGEVIIREYREFGYRESPLEDAEQNWPGKCDIWRVKGSTLVDCYRATSEMREFPKKYGYFHLLWAGFFMLFFRRVTKRFLPKECDKHPPTCSEAVCRAWQRVGLHLVPGVPARLTSPGDIVRSGKVFKVNHG